MIHTSPYPSLNARFAAVPQLVRQVAERSPDHPAIVDASSRAVVTYAALAGQIDRVAAELAGRGFAPGNVLALRAPNSSAWAAVALGAMAAAARSPASARWPPRPRPPRSSPAHPQRSWSASPIAARLAIARRPFIP